jgi:hypothetical protein
MRESGPSAFSNPFLDEMRGTDPHTLLTGQADELQVIVGGQEIVLAHRQTIYDSHRVVPDIEHRGKGVPDTSHRPAGQRQSQPVNPVHHRH